MARGDGYRTKQLDLCREKIKTSQLINRLQDNALAPQNALDANQIRCIEILLRKSVPDLSAVEQRSEVTNYVAALPEVCSSAEEWMAKAQKPVECPRTAEAPEATEIPVKH